MNRLQKQFMTAAALVVVGGGAGLYTLQQKVKTPEVRLRELRESQRLFKFGRIDVKKGHLQSTTATVTFERNDRGRFLLTAPVAWTANQDAFNSMLDHMAGLAMERVLTEDATPEELERAGLVRPPVTLTVDLRDGRTLTLHIGPKNKLVDRYPVTDVNKKRIALIEPTGYWNYARPLEEYRTKQVFDVDPDDVTELQITDADGQRRLALMRQDTGWQLLGPSGPAEPADDNYVSLFMVRLTKHLDADHYVTDSYDGSNAAEYGLAPPALHIRLTAGDRSVGGKVGFVEETDSDEATTVVHVDGTRTLVRNTDPTLKQDLTKPAGTFVDRTISKFDMLNAQEVILRNAGQPPVRAERSEDGWNIVEPEAREAKPWKLDAIVRVLSLLRATRWHVEAAKTEQLDEWRLAPWSRRLTVKAKDGSVLADVVFGKYADDKHLFAKAFEASRVGLVADTALRVLPAKWEELVP